MTPASPIAVQEEVQRNSKCSCGSGLKYKKCHGNEALQQECRLLVQLMVFKRITEARGRARLISKADCEVLVSRLDNQMIDMIVGPDEEEPNEVTREALEQSERGEDDALPEPIEDKNVKELQTDLDRCPTCGAVTFGKECIKCKRRADGETVA